MQSFNPLHPLHTWPHFHPVCFTRQVYTQLAEDDKIRYKNEMKSWEDHMVEIGREDLIRERTATKKKLATKKSAAKVATKSAKSKSAAKGAGKTKPKTTKKTIRRS